MNKRRAPANRPASAAPAVASPDEVSPDEVSTDSTDLVRARGVGKVYGSGPAAVAALQDVDLRIGAGDLLVVLGPSGSGKTTLLNVIGGIETPSSGRISVGGRDLAGLDTEALSQVRRTTVGFVFQFFNLIPTLTAEENVALLAELTGDTGRDAVRRRIQDVLGEVGLADRARHFPGQLSGGQQQRVAIARALVKQPRLLLCDEPTGALDPPTGRTVLALLQRLAHSGGRAVVVVTHNQALTAAADRVVRMRSGRIADDQPNPHPVDASEVSW
jgi:putative ABC transport system ATP-binding protein